MKWMHKECSYSLNRKQFIENKHNRKLGLQAIFRGSSYSIQQVKHTTILSREGRTCEYKVPTVFADQWTHLRCRSGLGWTNRRRRWQVFLQGSKRSGPVASDLPSDRQCVSEPASVSARVGRRRCPAPHTAPGGHAHLYRHTRPEAAAIRACWSCAFGACL